MVTYTYDEWGYVKRVICGKDEEKLANTNPIRYRGYYYDTETGYYYLQSRYYDPSICRFINSDAIEISNLAKNMNVGTNLFAYCNNDPVNFSDPTGYFTVKRWMVAMPIDMVLMATPAGALFAPIKTAAKKFGMMVVKKKFSANIFKVLNWLCKNIYKVVSKVIKAIQSVKAIKNFKFIKKLSPSKITGSILGFTLIKTPTYKTLNLLIKNVDIVLSLGGFVSGILDLAIDKKLNNCIWKI